MNTDGLILTVLFASSLDCSDPVKRMQGRNMSDAAIASGIDALIKKGMLNEDRSLTKLGRASFTVVLAGGVFDIIHPGHIHTLDSAKKLADVLVVVVATDRTAKSMKKRSPIHHQNQRRNLVGSLSVVDACMIGSDADIFETVNRVRPDIIALGYDQAHQEKFITEGCKRISLDADIQRLHALDPEISSSSIEKKYGEAIHDL